MMNNVISYTAQFGAPFASMVKEVEPLAERSNPPQTKTPAL
jgi:hypothetical protein